MSGLAKTATVPFAIKAHIRYALRHVRMLPPPYQSDDANRITFGFFALGSLAILGALDRLQPEERANYIDWVYQRWDHQLGGFSGAPRIDSRIPRLGVQSFDSPHLTHTYTALLILALLSLPTQEDPCPTTPFGRLDLAKLLQFVKQCQRPNGSFGSSPNSLEHDVRFIYCAVAILTIVNVDPSTLIDIKSTVEFLKSCRRYEGGYGQAPYHEAQGGTTYCVLASLALLNQLEVGLDDGEANRTLRWLVDRQMNFEQSQDCNDEPGSDDDDDDDDNGDDDDDDDAHELKNTARVCSQHFEEPTLLQTKAAPPQKSMVAGFQGRAGKALDACYSFWCLAALEILARRQPLKADRAESRDTDDRARPGKHWNLIALYEPSANVDFLLECQSPQWGGISRYPDDHPDVYHSYLAFASLSMSYRHANTAQLCTPSESTELYHQPLNALAVHDPLLNVPKQVSDWVRKCFL